MLYRSGKDSNSSTTGPTAATNATKTATPSSPGSSAEAFPLSYIRHSSETSTPVPRAASKTYLFGRSTKCAVTGFSLLTSNETLSREHSHQIKKGLIIPQFQTGIPLLLTLSKQTCGAEKEERLLRVPSIQARGHLPIQMNGPVDAH